MKTVIFDIETIPQDFGSFDDTQKQYLLKFANSRKDEKKVKEQMALWAPTNKIVAIGMLSVESEKGVVYYHDNNKKTEDFEEGNIKYYCGSEKEILEKFWKAIAHANKFVTFNGRGFDCPVLMLRSAMLKVKPSKNLVPYRYSTDQHIDLLEQLTFYSAARKFNLDFYCKAFGIKSPKSGGVTGHDVKPLFESGEYEKIARYCAGDLWATRELYLRWREYMSF
ncbi:3'-5' exonuclease [Candidatus Parcubacteria bacterium]|jgi:3'-5' exonuclease|nr:3'-5' exonuclease [Candidatus Parcubacteria bacterium]MBT3949121.1 3'-5' exonuclease [Candidatus Parcubacteria bacterium]